uniref:Uncharacterized protein n=1 Tax=Tanacetum cinerariifolium TaxID=118510 RepID=A0A699Q6L6_TANCI|nr:hypothetical protein [Tanacetum cinerariifolium]
MSSASSLMGSMRGTSVNMITQASSADSAMPPRPPAIPPMPVTEPTARFGNMSDTVVKMLALQAWWAAAAMPITNTASHIFSCPRYCANTIGNTQKAMTSMAVLRAWKAGMPRLIKPMGR